MLNSKNNVFNPYFNWYLSNEKNFFTDNSRVEPTIFFHGKILFSLKLFSGHFYGQSFIKSARVPLPVTIAKRVHVIKAHLFIYSEGRLSRGAYI